MAPSPNRREHFRAPTRFPVAFRGEQVRGAGVVTDISMGGCALETDARPPVGTILQLQLQISDGRPALEVDAAMVRSIEPKGVAVRFLRLQAQEQERLRQLVQGP